MSIREIFKPLDGLLVVFLLAVALLWSKCDREFDKESEPDSLRIVSSLTDDTISLFKDTLIVREHLTIEIKNMRAAITQSDCPTGQCVQTGFIGSPGQISACMPKETWIEILGSEKTTDVVTY